MTFEIDVDFNIVRFTPTGKLTAEVINDLVRQAIEHPDFEPGMGSLWDLCHVDLNEFTRQDVLKIRRYNMSIADKRGVARMAYVAQSDLAFGLARLYEVLGQQPNAKKHVFRDLASAEKWLLES